MCVLLSEGQLSVQVRVVLKQTPYYQSLICQVNGKDFFFSL